MSEEQRLWSGPAWGIEAEQAAKRARAELRDRFAMAALTGLVGDYHDNAAAKLAYEYADAMLKARGDD